MAHDRACGSLASLLRDDPPAPARSAPEEVHGPRKQKIAKVYDVETGTLRALGSGGGHAHLAAEIAIHWKSPDSVHRVDRVRARSNASVTPLPRTAYSRRHPGG